MAASGRHLQQRVEREMVLEKQIERLLTALMTGQHLLYWSVITVDEESPLMEGRPLMQPCAAFCNPLRKEEAT